MYWPGIVPPKTSLTNSKPCAALHRLDAEKDFAELARAAGLLFVAMMPFGLAGDRLAIGDLWRLGVDVQAAVLQLFQDQPQVHFADAIDDHLVRLAIGVIFERRIFLGEFRQRAGDFLLVAARLGRDRQPVHRRREDIGLQVHAVERMIIVQHIVGVDFFDLRHRADIAGDDLIGLLVLLALQVKHVPELDRFLGVADVDLALPEHFP